MASIKPYKRGWRAQVAIKGVRRSQIFDSKRDAQLWAAAQEYEIRNAPAPSTKFSLEDAFDRYAREVSGSKRGARWEIIRLERFKAYDIARIAVGEVKPADLAKWRDERLREVKPATVRREMQLMSSVFTVARKEWGWIAASPMADVRKPSKPPPRERRVTERELEALALSAGGDLTKRTARAFHAFLFAIETGMRAGEILRLEREDVAGSVARVHKSKTGLPRDVPLSGEALRLLDALPVADTFFDLTADQLDSLWRKLRDRAGVVDLTFHDSRHIAITRLSKKLDVLALAKMVGHQDIKQLMTYFDESAEDIAKRLN